MSLTTKTSKTHSIEVLEKQIEYLRKGIFRCGVSMFGDEFKLIPQMKPLVDLLCFRLVRHPNYLNMTDSMGRSFDFSRGIVVIGDVRIGKTWTMKAYHRLVSGTVSQNLILPAEKLCLDVKKNGPSVVLGVVDTLKRESSTLMIDDLGEDDLVRYMGDTYDPISLLFKELDNQEMFEGVFGTSNRSFREIQNRYDKRAWARIYQRCDFVRLSGKNLTEI